MKQIFRHYMALTDKDISDIWESGLVVPDTNVLLDFYCYGKETLDDYQTVLAVAKEKQCLWLPYQIGLEFFENRLGVINKQLKQYDNLITYLEGAKTRITDLKNTSPSHSYLDFDAIAKKYESAVAPLQRDILKQQKRHPDHLGVDLVLKNLKDVFEDSLIGTNFTEEEFEALVEEGEQRYKKKIPPGYKDENKKESENSPSRYRKYGDLIVWKQIIDKAKSSGKPVIFVTNDAKEDWIWTTGDGRKLGALPALRKELLEEAKVDLLIYSADEFLEEAKKRYELPIKQTSLTEVKKYRELEMERINSSRNYVAHAPRSSFREDHLHAVVRRARMLSRRARTHVAEHNEFPKRLEETVIELTGVYASIHSSLHRDNSLFFELLNHANRLVQRVLNINDNQNSELELMFKELRFLNAEVQGIAEIAHDDHSLPLFEL